MLQHYNFLSTNVINKYSVSIQMVLMSALKACFKILKLNVYKILYRASGGQCQNLNFAS